MSKTFLHLLSIAGYLAASAAAGSPSVQSEIIDEIAGPELIRNGGFDETGGGDGVPFAHWTGRNGQGGAYRFERAPGKTGGSALISGAKAGRAHLLNQGGFTVKAGEILRVRFFTRTENFSGGAFANLEGEPNNDGWKKINIEASTDWQLHEIRVKVPPGSKGQLEPNILIWFYHFGTGDLFIDDVSACVVKPDPAAQARREMGRIASWGDAFTGVNDVAERIRAVVTEAGAAPTTESVELARRSALTVISNHQGGDGTFIVGVASALDRVFLDEPCVATFARPLNISLARNEIEGAQLIVSSTGGEVKDVRASLEGGLTGPGGAVLPGESIKIKLVGFVDTAHGKRPYQSVKLGWWPDPLLPNAAFDVKPDESQPLLVTVTTTDGTPPGDYEGRLTIVSEAAKVLMPITVTVHPFTLSTKGHLATLVLGSNPRTVAKFYGEDPGEKIAERFALEAARHRMPPGGLLNGWGWKTAKVPKLGKSYDFTELDRWIDLLGPYVTRFPLATVPRFRKFGGGDYSANFKNELEAFVTAYAAHLKAKGIYDSAVFYNIDEASNSAKLREWDVCREMFSLSRRAAPDLPVMQCLNEFKGVQALSGHADIWDLYFGQYELAGGPVRLKAGDEVTLAVCIWPSEHPNLFIEYPLLDARVMPWICFRTGAQGFEYWDLFQSWDANTGNLDWWKSGDGTRTAWRLAKPHGDGLLIYPGPDGMPLNSLRLEALRDGIEDYEYLTQLSAIKGIEAAALVKEAKEKLITGVTSFDSNPAALLDLRARIANLLSKQ